MDVSAIDALDVLQDYARGVRDFVGLSLRGADLIGADLSGADLGGMDLTQARLEGSLLLEVNLVEALLVGAELRSAVLARSNLQGADLQGADLQGVDLRGANLKQACLALGNLEGVDGRGANLTAATLEQANLRGSQWGRAVLSGVDLRGADLRHGQLDCVNLSGANLAGANLRWANLSGANLRWADLSGANLAGANLAGADLGNGILQGATLVQADLSGANLSRVEWRSVDLSGAVLTGARLYETSRFGLTATGVVCEWVDLSERGDRSRVYRWPNQLLGQPSGQDLELGMGLASGASTPGDFFRPAVPEVELWVDAPLLPEQHVILARFYQQLIQRCGLVVQYPPSLEVSRRRTVLRFSLGTESRLLALAYCAIQPFRDRQVVQEQLQLLLPSLDQATHAFGARERILVQQLNRWLEPLLDRLPQLPPMEERVQSFFAAPTQTLLRNSQGQELALYRHPHFGKRIVNISATITRSAGLPQEERRSIRLTPAQALDFLRGFDSLECRDLLR